MRWALEHSGRGVFALRGYGDSRFTGGRLAKAGQKLVARFKLKYIKGDWSEFAHTFGLPNWKTRLAPCPWCLCTTSEWLDFSDVTRRIEDNIPWPPLTGNDYDDACKACEIVVKVESREVHTTIIAGLEYDKRLYGARGRALKIEIPALRLQPGDRLEPNESVPDVAQFDAKRGYPFDVTFWRRSRETACRHRNPLFAIPGVSCENLMSDMLHCVFLGIAQAYIATVIWLMFVSNVWQIQATTRGALEEIAVQRLRSEILEFYESTRRLYPASSRTELQDLTIGMLGSRDARIFKAKGAETKGLIPFAIGLLERYGAPCRPEAAPHLLTAGKSLMEVIRVQAAYGTCIPAGECSYMYKCGIQHIRSAFSGGVPPLPKHHQFLHLLRGAAFNGNPRVYACWFDESLNKTIAGVAAKAHISVWEARILEYMNILTKAASEA